MPKPTKEEERAHDATAAADGLARAVIYLRVSTKEQAEMGGEAEGFSIPAQRAACLRKSEALGASVEEEFVDRGESAKTANRPELMSMLRYLRTHPVNYVIVHKVDRLARSRADDVAITLEIRRSGATLVSCSENIDETPSGILLHGIMSSIAEFYSLNLATEVQKGMTQKAKSGGTVVKAPVGYLHVRTKENGREARGVVIDPERGPIVRWAFEQYATGQWTVQQLLEAITRRGLTSRPGPRTPAARITKGALAKMLANPYYTGKIIYRGVRYDGKHEALISQEVFDQVQDVLVAHNYAGEKQRVHHHYLKGSIFCGTCGSRMGISNSRSHTGAVYDYFYCLGRQRNRFSCNRSVIRIAKVEKLVEDHYRTVQLPAENVPEVLNQIRDALASRRDEAEAEEHTQQLRIQNLNNERRKLLQLHYAEALPIELFKQEQERITAELEDARQRLAAVSIAFDTIEVNAQRALELARDCHAAYADASPSMRRLFNQAFFVKLTLHDDDIVTHEFAEPFRLLLDPDFGRKLEEETRALNSHSASGWTVDEDDLAISEAVGSNVSTLVGPAGLEPATGRL